MKLSVLDYGVIDFGKNANTALKETCELAKYAEKLGYSRFWLAEHHNISAFSTSVPEILISYILANTKSIRVGSGGIMALHYSPYKIAEIINTLQTLYPNRVDIAFGNTLGSNRVHRALKSHFEKNDYEKVLKDISEYIEQKKNISVCPSIEEKPEFFLLSNSKKTYELSREIDFKYTFGVFPYMPVDMYKEVKKIENVDMLACFVVVAETNELALEFAKCLDIWMLGKDEFNEFKTYPSIEEANKYILTENEKQKVLENRKRMIVGDAKIVKKQLDEYIGISNAKELIIIPLVPDIENRFRSLEILANMYIDKRKGR